MIGHHKPLCRRGGSARERSPGAVAPTPATYSALAISVTQRKDCTTCALGIRLSFGTRLSRVDASSNSCALHIAAEGNRGHCIARSQRGSRPRPRHLARVGTRRQAGVCTTLLEERDRGCRCANGAGRAGPRCFADVRSLLAQCGERRHGCALEIDEGNL